LPAPCRNRAVPPLHPPPAPAARRPGAVAATALAPIQAARHRRRSGPESGPAPPAPALSPQPP
jgi:hypothetical protein